MGLAELATLGIPHDSPAAVSLAGRLLRVITAEARLTSASLAAERGPFPLYAQSTYPRRASGRTGTVRQLPYVPPEVRAAFVTVLEIAPAWHLKMQAAVQRCRSTTPTAAAATRMPANSDPSGRPARL